MGITNRDLDQAYELYKTQYGGRREDYFALLYLTREFDRIPEQVARHIAFGKDATEGVNAFHVDPNRRNLYLYQFQWSAQQQSFKEPLRHLAREGMERIFGPAPEAPGLLLAELRDRLHEDHAVIDKVLIHFVYNGDPSDADQSATLDALREDLESKKHLIDRRFDGRNVTLTFQFISNEARGPRVGSHTRSTHRYELGLPHVITSKTEAEEQLHVGFVGIVDLYKMFREMGQRLFERNIRAGLDPDGPINKKIRAAFADVVEGKSSASAFVFNHNGITISAEQLDIQGERAHITEPRVLNGAQTITSFARFIESYDFEKAPAEHADRLDAIKVLAKIVTRAQQPFITAVTINTNRQNSVEPANLRASDPIQLELQDKFRDELNGLLYERQEKLFASLSEEEMIEQGFDPTQSRAIEMKRLAKTFLAAQGEVDRMSRLNDMFETESQYRACFAERYLKTDARRILLAYKIQYRLPKIAKEIDESAKGYWYVPRAKNLLWALLVQGVLNHRQLPVWLEAYGKTISVETDFTQELLSLGVQKVRHIIREAVSEQKYKEQLAEGRLSFLQNKALYIYSMEVAERREGWSKLGL
ncbi:AIPR family protein [Bradyrhizobium sp. CB1717]|uniref:AIPR family protein n=1 Tax=Bradyrhizobium sp. CB1717 TaxID=3039154 RepID=UPI0024B0ABF7|nr:AIPR family protein [Bradyrhizobium sp. CB1717]WFU25126.1 AIPR family protein [Bradyrhizobium sp. CB1717]